MVRKQAGRKSLRAGEHSQAGVAIWGEELRLGKLFSPFYALSKDIYLYLFVFNAVISAEFLLPLKAASSSRFLCRDLTVGDWPGLEVQTGKLLL